jgi:hypothetical protein
MRILAALAMLTWLAGGALAQNADQPVMGSSAAQDFAGSEDSQQMTSVLVLGDGIGGGLGAGVTRVGEADGRYEVAIRFNEESGLARPEVYDWAETLPKILDSNAYDVIVVLLGSNDRQMIRSGNARHAFNTPGWIAAYKAQIDKLLNELSASGAKVYWVSIPPMADPEYDAAMRVITELQRERVSARGMAFLDIRKAFSNPDGSYTDTGADDTGSVRKLRARDGVSFFKQGNNRMGQLVLQAIASAGTSEPKTAKSAEPSAVAALPPARPREVPLFGQELMLGEIATLEPTDVTVNAMLVAGSDLAPAAALQAIRAMAREGSAAEKLFKLGEAVPAPRGRADDFSAPPPAPE